ncbi:alpha/beta hydrolase [Haloechinothrix sp. LS1_15]|uniref:alpha/beta fold hydrolase n=1 Tax=Haloechinothrix sp. LS1_15 TaxID=2652248 RepID=UPI0029476F0D|nr:alpha/beta hydrolase [Haloechinothrix sp. LS1_15]MDV6014044.1 alpha/beta hydrolase [Haloechinothrix sp. LS1_15]
MSAFTLSDGTVLHLVTHGDSEAPVTVLLVHAYALDHRSWQPIAAELAGATERPVRVVACDLRGHGRSTGATRRDATVEQLGDDLAELVTGLVTGLPRDACVIVAGHGMGGLAAVALAERHPALFGVTGTSRPPLVPGVMLLATGTSDVAGEARAATGMAVEGSRTPPNLLSKIVQDLEAVVGSRLVDLVTDRGHKAATTAMRWSMFGDDPAHDDVLLTLHMIRAHWPDTMALFRPGLDAYIRRATLTAPADTHVIGVIGDRDRLVAPEQARTLLGDERADDLVVIPGAGHMLPLEAPAQLIPRLVGLAHEAHRLLGDHPR